MSRYLTVSSRAELESALAALTTPDANGGCYVYIENGEYS
jgi:hypothetical protein